MQKRCRGRSKWLGQGGIQTWWMHEVAARSTSIRFGSFSRGVHDRSFTYPFCPPASTTCSYPCISSASPLGTSRLPYLTLWATFCALLGWQSGNLSVFGLHSHLSLSSTQPISWHSETMEPVFL